AARMYNRDALHAIDIAISADPRRGRLRNATTDRADVAAAPEIETTATKRALRPFGRARRATIGTASMNSAAGPELEEGAPLFEHEGLERLRRGRQALVLQMHHVPLPQNREPFHLQHHELAGGELEPDRVLGDEAHAHARHHRLLDGFVAVHLHVYPELQAALAEEMLHRRARSRSRFAHQERLLRHGLQRNALARRERM